MRWKDDTSRGDQCSHAIVQVLLSSLADPPFTSSNSHTGSAPLQIGV